MSDENNNENEIKNIIYLDYNATTYIHPEVVKVMQPYLTKYFGNPSSSHIFGVTTKKAINKSREQIASMLKCSPSEIIFTSGGSESNNYSIKGVVYHYLHNNTNNNSKYDIITSVIEHPSVLEVFKFLETTFPTQLNVIYLPVTNLGIIDINKFKSVLTKNCIFISIMHANNETGCLQPIKEICEIARKVNPNILIHSDASQSVGKVPVTVDKDNLLVDFLHEKENIAENPYMYPLSNNSVLQNEGYHRFLFYKSFVALYLIDDVEKVVSIMRIFYAKRDYAKLI